MGIFENVAFVMLFTGAAIGIVANIYSIYQQVTGELHWAFQLYRDAFFESYAPLKNKKINNLTEEELLSLQRELIKSVTATLPDPQQRLVLRSLEQESLNGRRKYIEKIMRLESHKARELGKPQDPEYRNQLELQTN